MCSYRYLSHSNVGLLNLASPPEVRTAEWGAAQVGADRGAVSAGPRPSGLREESLAGGVGGSRGDTRHRHVRHTHTHMIVDTS